MSSSITLGSRVKLMDLLVTAQFIIRAPKNVYSIYIYLYVYKCTAQSVRRHMIQQCSIFFSVSFNLLSESEFGPVHVCSRHFLRNPVRPVPVGCVVFNLIPLHSPAHVFFVIFTYFFFKPKGVFHVCLRPAQQRFCPHSQFLLCKRSDPIHFSRSAFRSCQRSPVCLRWLCLPVCGAGMWLLWNVWKLIAVDYFGPNQNIGRPAQDESWLIVTSHCTKIYLRVHHRA